MSESPGAARKRGGTTGNRDSRTQGVTRNRTRILPMTRRAASVVLYRPVRQGGAANAELDVYLVLRSPELKFLGGTMAFPGGVLDPGDEALPLAGLEGESGERAVVACAARELLEETGILAAAPGGPTRVP